MTGDRMKGIIQRASTATVRNAKVTIAEIADLAIFARDAATRADELRKIRAELESRIAESVSLHHAAEEALAVREATIVRVKAEIGFIERMAAAGPVREVNEVLQEAVVALRRAVAGPALAVTAPPSKED